MWIFLIITLIVLEELLRLYVARKTSEMAKKEVINKACEWLDSNFPSIDNIGSWYKEGFIKQFKKAMEE